MNIFENFPQFKRPLAWLLIAAALVLPARGAHLVEETFPVLKTRTGTYTNVTVTTHADSYVFILHSTGMTSIKIQDLPVDVRRQLGYPTPDAPATATADVTTTSVSAKETPGAATASADPQAQVKELRARILRNLAAAKINSEVIMMILVVGFLLYLFHCYCWSQICSKAGSPGGLLVWVPGLQIFPILRAADMSGWWFLAFFVPLLNILASILLAVNITKARGKELWVALLLILPITNFFAFLYLAFSGGAPADDAPPSKFQPRRLQTA
jgi:hypothetical protein